MKKMKLGNKDENNTMNFDENEHGKYFDHVS